MSQVARWSMIWSCAFSVQITELRPVTDVAESQGALLLSLCISLDVNSCRAGKHICNSVLIDMTTVSLLMLAQSEYQQPC